MSRLVPIDNNGWTHRRQDELRETMGRFAKAIVLRLAGHAMGEEEMTKSEVRAAEILLRKILPDLSATEITNTRQGLSPQEAEKRREIIIRTLREQGILENKPQKTNIVQLAKPQTGIEIIPTRDDDLPVENMDPD